MRRHRASSSAGRPGNTGFYIGFEALLIISLFVSSAVGIVPPYRGSGSLHGHNSTTSFSWVPFRKPSRRLNLRKNGYKTRLLHDELCRYETDDMCKEIDEAMQSQARRSLQIARTSGQLKVLVILIQFKDHETRSMVPRDDIDYLFNGEGRNEIAPSGSVRSYMRINSYNKFDMKATVAEWVKIDKTEKECSFDNSGLDRRFQECVWPALDVLEARHQDPSDDFTWEDYDVNYDGFMDSVVVLHSGYSAEYGDIDPDGADEQVRIWSHAVGAQPNRWKSPSFLVDIGYYCVTSSFRGIRGEKIARIGILVHEMLHTLGLPDLYDLSRTGQGGGAGQFSIMSNPWGQGNDPTLPGHLDPWSKIKLGWVDPIRITQNQDITIQPSELVPDILMVDRPFPHEEYLLIENRQALHYDANMWSGGVLVWHIDDAVVSCSLSLNLIEILALFG
jgi:immune inhibitor A